MLAGAAAWGTLHAIGDAIPFASLPGSLARCALGGTAGALVFLAAARFLGVEELREAIARTLRRRGA
jgi:hypothetical protein